MVAERGTGRLSTGVEGLDERLGGGLLPGTLTVVVGSAGIGKTQLGLQFLSAGCVQEGRGGIVFDMSSRGDSQNHSEYARRMFDWQLDPIAPELHVPLDDELPLFAADEHAAGDAQRDLMTLLRSLPDKQRRAIECVKIEGLSVVETARLTGLSESAVKVGVHRGLKALAARFVQARKIGAGRP